MRRFQFALLVDRFAASGSLGSKSFPMSLTFWIKRFLIVYAGVFLALLVIALLRNRALARAATESALWAGISTAIFIGTRLYHSRKGRHCALCRDTPEVRHDSASELKK